MKMHTAPAMSSGNGTRGFSLPSPTEREGRDELFCDAPNLQNLPSVHIG